MRSNQLVPELRSVSTVQLSLSSASSSQAPKMDGPDPGFKVDESSLGEFLLNRLKSHPPNDIIHINAETGEQRTVSELLLGAIELAAGLEARGISQGDVIMLMGKYSANLYSVVLAAAFQNAILFPVDYNLTDCETVSHVTGLCQPKIVFCDNAVSARVTTALKTMKSRAEVVLLDGGSEPGVRFDDVVEKNSSGYQLQPVRDPKNEIILLIGSSGTTGKPKGVLLTHRCFVYTCQIWEGVEPVKKKLRNMLASQITWITGLTIFITSCATGFPIVYTRDLLPQTLIKAVHQYRPQWMFTMPKVLREISNLPDFKDYDLSSLKDISVGGAPLDAKTRSIVHETWPHGVVLNQSYGCTEIGSFITEPFGGAPIASAGRLIRGTHCKVMDTATGEKLKPNEIGKLAFRCDETMMKGYLNNPEATAQAIDNEGFYYTGDIGYITEEGFVYITGRISDMLLVNSELVSPAELENTIGTIEGVVDVAVVGKPHELDNNHPIAAVVIKPGSGITEKQIISHVEKNLSGFKRLFGGVQFVDQIPRNTNGKILRKQVLTMLGI